MSEHASLVHRLVPVSGYYREQGGRIVYVNPYNAWRQVRPEDIANEEWAAKPLNEEFARSAKQTFKSFVNLANKYARYVKQREALRGYLSQLFPSATERTLQQLTSEDNVPLTLFYIAPLLPEEERRIVEETLCISAACVDDITTLSLYKAMSSFAATADSAEKIRRAEQLQKAMYQEATYDDLLPSCSFGVTAPYFLAERIITLWQIFRQANDPTIQEHAKDILSFSQHLLLAEMVSRTAGKLAESIRVGDCIAGLDAICGGLRALSAFASMVSVKQEDTETWDYFAETGSVLAGALSKLSASLIRAAAKYITGGEQAKSEFAILADALERLPQVIDRHVHAPAYKVEQAPWRAIPTCLTWCLAVSTYEHFGETYKETDASSNSFHFLRRMAMHIQERKADEWHKELCDTVQHLQEVRELLAYAEDDERKWIERAIEERIKEFENRHMDAARREDVSSLLSFIRMALARDISGYYQHSAWDDRVADLTRTISNYCQTTQRQLERRRGIGVTEEDVENAHAELASLFGSPYCYEMSVTLPPEYEEDVERLSKGMAIALQGLAEAMAGQAIGKMIARKGSREKLQRKLASAMIRVLKGKVRQKVTSLGVDELLRDTLIQVFRPAIPPDLQKRLRDLKRYKTILQAVAAVQRAAKQREGTQAVKLPKKLTQAYDRRFELPIAQELKGKVSGEELEREIWKYVCSCLQASKELKHLQTQLTETLEAAFRAATGNAKADYAYFIAHYAHDALGIPIDPQQPREERIRKVASRIRQGIQLQPRPAILRIAWDFDSFINLGNYGPDSGSCYREDGMRPYDRYKLATQEGSFVATLYTARGRERAAERGQERCVARLWGICTRLPGTHSGRKRYKVYVTNVYAGGNEIIRRGLIRGVIDAFKQALNARVVSQTPMSDHPVIRDADIWQNGDGRLYTLETKEA